MSVLGGFRFCPRPWKNASEYAADALCFPGRGVEAGRLGRVASNGAIRF
jgi:hypothetical protein